MNKQTLNSFNIFFYFFNIFYKPNIILITNKYDKSGHVKYVFM